MQQKSITPSIIAWIILPPPTNNIAPLRVKYVRILLLLLYWSILSSLTPWDNPPLTVGDGIPPGMAALMLTPYLIIPAFLCMAVHTDRQWRSLMIPIYIGLLLNLGLTLIIPANASWGDLPAIGSCGALAWPRDIHSEWIITLPCFSLFWGLLIYIFLRGNTKSSILHLVVMIWWVTLFLAPLNTGIIGYADILGPLLITAAILIGMTRTKANKG